MDHLRQGIHLRGYAQKDPKQEYKRESFELFTALLEALKYEIVKLIASVEISSEADLEQVEAQRRSDAAVKLELIHDDIAQDEQETRQLTQITFRHDSKKVGRNDLCHCGSEKKYKNCHGRLA